MLRPRVCTCIYMYIYVCVCVSDEFYQKRLFIFLTKQFENSSLINDIGRRDSHPQPRLVSLAPLRNAKTGSPRLMVFLSSLRSSKNSVGIHKFRKHSPGEDVLLRSRAPIPSLSLVNYNVQDNYTTQQFGTF